MKTEQEQLAECRAHWEAAKPDAVFPDYWLGWKSARETLVIELPKPLPSGEYRMASPVYLASVVIKSLQESGVKVSV
jgi:hypothetical protein